MVEKQWFWCHAGKGHRKSGSKMELAELNFQNPAAPKPQITTLLQDSQSMDPLPSHPKSHYGCFK
jgi:hypothetical protein